MNAKGGTNERNAAPDRARRRWRALPPLVVLVMASFPVAFPHAARAGAPSPSAVPNVEHRIFTLLDYYESGRQAVESFIQASAASGAAPDLAATVRRSKEFCLRLDIRFDQGASRIESAVATGVLVDGGRKILTAGHSFEGSGEITIVATYLDGTRRAAHVLERQYDRFGTSEQDWAVLEIVDPPAWPAARVSPERAQEGDMVIVLGYPDEIGIDNEGNVGYATAEDTARHQPLTTIAVVGRAAPVLLEPWVGSIPTRGMSGAPVFDFQGRLVGIFVAVNATRVGPEVTHAYEACSAETVRGSRALARNPRMTAP